MAHLVICMKMNNFCFIFEEESIQVIVRTFTTYVTNMCYLFKVGHFVAHFQNHLLLFCFVFCFWSADY